MDPELTLGCPPGVTAASGLDALTQCLEPFVSARRTRSRTGSPGRVWPGRRPGASPGYADGSDVDARTDMALCSLLGGMALANAKLGAVHGIAGVSAGWSPSARRRLCGAAPTGRRGERAGTGGSAGTPGPRRCGPGAGTVRGGGPAADRAPDATVEQGVAWLRETVSRLGVPGLDAYGVPVQRLDEIVAKAAGSSSMKGNPVPLSSAVLHAVLVAAR